MSIVISDTVDGLFELKALPEGECLNDLSNEELVKRIPELFAAKLPISVSGVVTGVATPGEADRDKAWLRRDTRGNVLGWWVFDGGAWNKLYDVAEGEVRWINGNSNIPPKGWTVIEEGDPTMSSNAVASYVSQYVPLSSGPGWEKYAVRFSGFEEP